MELKKSPVVFNERDHSYELEGRRLLGITGLIHSVLGLGVYPEASDYVKGYAIPRAGSRGTAVHHAIQEFDETGVMRTEQNVDTTYYRGTDREYSVVETWDVYNELLHYTDHLSRYGFMPIANELTVSDNEKWASQIDNVWHSVETGGIWLVDTKTNNVSLYPLCGYFNNSYFNDRKEALKEYLSWQLSVYAELFEKENPTLKVEGLACNWLRPDEGEFWIIERKPSHLVWELLKTDYVFLDNGPSYYHPNPGVFGIEPELPVVKENTLPILPEDVIDYVASLLEIERDAKAKLEAVKAQMREAMERHGVKSWDSGRFKATIAADSERSTFDTASFKKDHPDLYKQYVIKKATKGGFTLKTTEK